MSGVTYRYVLIGTEGRSRLTVYTVEEAAFQKQLDTNDSDAQTAAWVKRHGTPGYTTGYAWAYGIGGEG